MFASELNISQIKDPNKGEAKQSQQKLVFRSQFQPPSNKKKAKRFIIRCKGPSCKKALVNGDQMKKFDKDCLENENIYKILVEKPSEIRPTIDWRIKQIIKIIINFSEILLSPPVKELFIYARS